MQDFVKRGGKLVTPPSKPFNDPDLLDGLSVAAVLKRLPLTGG